MACTAMAQVSADAEWLGSADSANESNEEEWQGRAADVAGLVHVDVGSYRYAALPLADDQGFANQNMQHASLPQDPYLVSSPGWFGLRKMVPGGHLIFQYADLRARPALEASLADMPIHAGGDNPASIYASYWLDSGYDFSSAFALGYRWRGLRFEGAAFSRESLEGQRVQAREVSRLDSRSARLSFNLAKDWSIQVSRGALSGIDQVVAGADVRRTTLSSTYRYRFKEGGWETTLAWGRNSRRNLETTVGYLMESRLRFSGFHTVFGRIEQVGSGELIRENDSQQKPAFKLNKVTFGYFQEIQASNALTFDIGMLVNKYLVPDHMTASYQREPVAYMAFIQMKFR